ncbi:GNAT family N-acetyltransferase [Pectobacterium aroidearum]|uniref:GNAT family N-acetyltransferase n=1 Tax=Pectobacterium aroidearum TaxID=1201031 RepID=UPI0015F6CE48|nr:GNAT family N-acetyltransferase [Pectobacterium aroidearum]MBA5601039.1 GNAT family N-acetyltransferase [Pectobacterium aroidearum]
MTRAITDPYDGLLSLQQALDTGGVTPGKGTLFPELSTVFDSPNGNWRMTYALIENGRVKASAVFVIASPLNGKHCFGIGYSVSEADRGKGLALALVEKSIKELQFNMQGKLTEFYVEALVGATNLASQKVAEKFTLSEGEPFTEQLSGLPALRYVKLVA